MFLTLFQAFSFVQSNLAFWLTIGRRTRRVIKLGDKVTVQVFKVDGFKKQTDFQLAAERRLQRSGRRY